MKLSFLTDQALATLRGQLPDNLSCYMSNDVGFFDDMLECINGFVMDSEFDFPSFSLDMTSDFAISDPYNVRTLYSALRDLPPSIACDERLWVGLAHGIFWDYVQYRQQEQISSGDVRKIATSFFFTNGRKRSLYVNCLSRLWWTGHLTYDRDNKEDPFALTDLITKNAFPSTITLFSSSNMTSNPQICLGVLDSIRKRAQAGEDIKRKHFVGSLRYLNNMGGITLLDVLDRSEITEIIIDYLASDEFARLKLASRRNAPEPIADDDELPALARTVEASSTSVEQANQIEQTEQVEARASFDPVIDSIEYYGYEYVDMRANGGALWVVGGEELEEFAEYWRDQLVVFQFADRGNRATKWKPGWWTMDMSPE